MNSGIGQDLAQPSVADDPSAPPIDHVYLRKFTFGNRALEKEVLQLFAGQAPSTLAQLQAANDAKAWHAAAHTLKGSARAVGALALADVAAEAEKLGPAAEARAAVLARLTMALDEATAYIAALPAA